MEQLEQWNMTEGVHHLSTKQLVLSSVRKKNGLANLGRLSIFPRFTETSRIFSGNTIHNWNMSLIFLGLPLNEIVPFLFLPQNRFFLINATAYSSFPSLIEKLGKRSLDCYRCTVLGSLHATHKHFFTVFFQLSNILCQGASFSKLSQ